jgi:hypothetical protein
MTFRPNNENNETAGLTDYFLKGNEKGPLRANAICMWKQKQNATTVIAIGQILKSRS